MTQEARDLEAFLRGLEVEGAQTLADEAGNLAIKLEAAGIERIDKKAPQIELPQAIRTETLKIRTMSKEALMKEYEQRGIHVSSYAQDLISKIKLSKEPKDINLAWLSGRDLGLTASAPYREFLKAGKTKGYNLCEPEVGLYLRLQDLNQPLNDIYWMAMEPILDRDGHPSVFGGGARWRWVVVACGLGVSARQVGSGPSLGLRCQQVRNFDFFNFLVILIL